MSNKIVLEIDLYIASSILKLDKTSWTHGSEQNCQEIAWLIYYVVNYSFFVEKAISNATFKLYTLLLYIRFLVNVHFLCNLCVNQEKIVVE